MEIGIESGRLRIFFGKRTSEMEVGNFGVGSKILREAHFLEWSFCEMQGNVLSILLRRTFVVQSGLSGFDFKVAARNGV